MFDRLIQSTISLKRTRASQVSNGPQKRRTLKVSHFILCSSFSSLSFSLPFLLNPAPSLISPTTKTTTSQPLLQLSPKALTPSTNPISIVRIKPALLPLMVLLSPCPCPRSRARSRVIVHWRRRTRWTLRVDLQRRTTSSRTTGGIVLMLLMLLILLLRLLLRIRSVHLLLLLLL